MQMAATWPAQSECELWPDNEVLLRHADASKRTVVVVRFNAQRHGFGEIELR
jgi:hypothetical protein